MFAPPHPDLLEASHMYASSDAHRLSFASTASSDSPTQQQHAQLPQGSSSGSSGAVRRPPRKSTLTQQQKNQKRQRATQDQLILLELEFNKNPTPTAIVRDRIANDINMTERSVQIWFQNRRAKIKLLAKKSLENGEDCDSISENVRMYLANQNPDMKALAYGTSAGMGYGAGFPTPEQAPSGKIVIHHFTCRSLNIGSWRRIGQNMMDLVIFYSPEKACITYYINNDSAGYKIEYPFRNIKSIELETLNVPMANQNTHGGQMQAQLVIQLIRPPNFFMDTSGSGGFKQCGDFTEDQQATHILCHTLGGNSKSLQAQLAKLLNCDAFQNRHRQPFMFDTTFAGPPSPPIRPSSSSGMMAPPSLVQQEARGQMLANPYRHKRQRSRSVPNINDFAAFGPMPTFHFEDVIIEPENEQEFLFGNSPRLEDNGNHNQLFAPAPQHPHALSNNLRIDTTAPGFLDYRPVYPLSAATTASVSEYATSPGFNSAMPSELATSNGMPSPFVGEPWLSPMVNPNGLIPQSVSPLSALSNGDPIIASGSPPFLDRTGSADLFPLSHEQALYGEDGLTDLYAKQSLALQQSPPALEDLENLDVHLTPYNLSPMGQQVSLSPEQQPHASPSHQE